MPKRSLSPNFDKMMEREGFILTRIATQLTKWPRVKLMKVIDEGFISYRRAGKKIYVNKEELLSYRFKKGDIKKITNESFIILQDKVKRLERKMEVLERILDLHYEPLELTEKEIHAIYLEAERFDIRSYTSVNRWAEVLLRIDENHLRMLAKYIDNEECWKPFIEVAYYCHFIARKKKMINIRRLTAKAYRNIKNSIIIYLKLPKKSDTYFRLFHSQKVIRKAKKNGSYAIITNINISKRTEVDLNSEDLPV